MIDEITNYFEFYFTEFEKDKNPIAGQILGILIQSKEPLSLDEIAEKLQLSKPAISIQIRILNDLGYCVKLPRKSDRKDYYKVNEYFVEQAISNRIKKHDLFIEDLKRIMKKKDATSNLTQARLQGVLEGLNHVRSNYSSTLEKLKNS